MTDFAVRFLLCNGIITLVTGLLLLLKRFGACMLTSRMQFRLWYLLTGLFLLPFIPIRIFGSFRPLSLVAAWWSRYVSDSSSGIAVPYRSANGTNTNWIPDFAVSVSQNPSVYLSTIFMVVWLSGILWMLLLTLRAWRRMWMLRSSALPLENPAVLALYRQCAKESGIQNPPEIYSTLCINSPISAGILHPSIYLPLFLACDCPLDRLRYMLLHELQHCRHRDAWLNLFMDLACILYWFNPMIRYARRKMQDDREIACDASVLELLNPSDRLDYGHTLIDFAAFGLNLHSFPASGLTGTHRQIHRRIRQIAAYRRFSGKDHRKSTAVFLLIALLLLSYVPWLTGYTFAPDHYDWNTANDVTNLELSDVFQGFQGTFVLYDMEQDHWSIYNQEQALKRVSPNSTYKIYDGLFALEEGVITPEDSVLAWNYLEYPFEAWEQDQNLRTALQLSVNWYFQALDKQMGKNVLQTRFQEIGYGNQNLGGDLDNYWMESSLKISAAEQVQLLTSLYRNEWNCQETNIQAVLDGIRLSSSPEGTLYGKTGTGRIDGQDQNGWFVGLIEAPGNTWFFAVNINSDSGATGSLATEITMDILSGLDIWNMPLTTSGE